MPGRLLLCLLKFGIELLVNVNYVLAGVPEDWGLDLWALDSEMRLFAQMV